MNDKEMIEKMARIANFTAFDYRQGAIQSKTIYTAIAEAIYEYMTENAVVLTKEEYDDLQVGKDFNYGYHEGEKNMKAYYENIKLPEARKETASK